MVTECSPSDPRGREDIVGRRKSLRVNSILDADLRRIRKPCEARAGHGLISCVILLTMIGLLVYGVVVIKRLIWGA